ncbi:Qnr family pentapeptide repeat protein [Candidatus Regiella endosymbiont of Tuberolachnus salignus]
MSSIYRSEKFDTDHFTGNVVKNCKFINCDFSGNDLTDTQFWECQFYDQENQIGCNFNCATLKDASFKNCDLMMNNFKFINALGIEIRECRAQGADFRGASFMNKISARTWFCSAYITKSNLNYANFSKVVLEKCELWENSWVDTNVLGAIFSGSDLSGGKFSSFDWRSATFTHCDLTNSAIDELDICSTDLEGVKLDICQVSGIMARLGIIVIE